MDAKVSKTVRQHRPGDLFNWPKAASNHKFRELIAYKSRRVFPAVILYFAFYLGVSTLAGFAPSVMAAKLWGFVPAGYVLILGTYLVAWGVALWYVRTARVEIDPLKAAALESIAGEKGAIS